MVIVKLDDRSSPRPWGCFPDTRWGGCHGWVFPTSVGVFLTIQVCHFARLGLPHVRGGVSKSAALILSKNRSSPRPWGCFQPAERLPDSGAVFPTSVGVFL